MQVFVILLLIISVFSLIELHSNQTYIYSFQMHH